MIKLREPWAFFASDDNLTDEELEELESHFHKDYSWELDKYCGIDWEGDELSYSRIESFDEDDNEDNVTVYTIEQLRAIIAEHLAKQPVEKLEDGVVYYAESKYDNFLFVNKKRWVNVTKKVSEADIVNWDKIETLYTFTKATPAQIAHYEACVKAGKYVESESVTEFIVGKWYKVVKYNYYGKFLKWDVDNNRLVASDYRIVGEVQRVIDGYYFNPGYDWVPVEDLSEIQESLPEGHPDKVVKHKSERYLATMKFFEQLREPERSEAIANYDEDYDTIVPESLAHAINIAFSWQENKWVELYNKIDKGTYFKEEFLVFGKYKVGDIVVSLKHAGVYRQVGELFTVLSNSKSNSLKYELTTSSREADTWRNATPEEVEAYNQGVRNIADIKHKQDKRAVKFNSEEEKRHILAHFNPRCLDLDGYDIGWICLDNGFWTSRLGALSHEDYSEISFQDWCKEFNHPFDYKEAVHCTTQEEWDFVLSKFNPKNVSLELWEEYYHNSYINTDKGSFGNIHGEGKSYNTILTFKQWCDKYNHSYEVVPWVAQVGDWAYVLNNGSSCLLTGDIVKCDHYSSGGNAHFETFRRTNNSPNSYLSHENYRKATQEEIDSVTIVVKAEAVGKPTYTTPTTGWDGSTKVNITEWTADNWYVEVTSQEEADSVIDAAAKMYGKHADKDLSFIKDSTDTSWHCVSLNDYRYSLLNWGTVKNLKPRPITDFINLPKTEAERIARQEARDTSSFLSASEQMLLTPKECYKPNTLDCSYLFAGEVTEKEFEEIKKLCKPQQDELVIYKPKRVIL